MVKERHDITGSNCLKGVLGKVILDVCCFNYVCMYVCMYTTFV